MSQIIKILFLISVVLFVVSIFQKGKLPDKEEILDELYQEPIQVKTEESPFETKRGEITYNIEPLYAYELYGLVVSYHDSESWFDYYHKQWQDFINVRDICVIWGNNIENEVYKQMEFSNGSFTCYPKFKRNSDSQWWSKYENSSLSNNHLLVFRNLKNSEITKEPEGRMSYSNEEIFKIIKKAEKGDQVHLKGQLVEYSHDGNSFKRGTSVTRTDTGNGACETIYVTDFEILKEGNSDWRDIHSFTKYSMLVLFVFLVIDFFFSSGNIYRDN